MFDARRRRLDRPLLLGCLVALLMPWLASRAGPLQPALALLALWALGYALVALVYPLGRLTRLERHALASASGLVLLPLVTVAVSLLVGLAPLSLALAISGLTLLFAAAPLARAAAPEPAAHAPVPGTRATLAIAVPVLVAAAILVAYGSPPSTAPAALAMVPADPEKGPIPRAVAVGDTVHVRWQLLAGDAPRAGLLEVTLRPLGDPQAPDAPGATATLLVERVSVPAGGVATRDVAVEFAQAGDHELVARWTLETGEVRQVRAPVLVVEAPG